MLESAVCYNVSASSPRMQRTNTHSFMYRTQHKKRRSKNNISWIYRRATFPARFPLFPRFNLTCTAVTSLQRRCGSVCVCVCVRVQPLLLFGIQIPARSYVQSCTNTTTSAPHRTPLPGWVGKHVHNYWPRHNMLRCAM